MKRIIVAIDGHSSCGKSTMAKELAREVGYVYVDTGAMYRAVTLFALDNGLFTEDGEVAVETLNHRMNEVQVASYWTPKQTSRSSRSTASSWKTESEAWLSAKKSASSPHCPLSEKP